MRAETVSILSTVLSPESNTAQTPGRASVKIYWLSQSIKNELQFSTYYIFKELAGGDSWGVTLEDKISQVPGQTPVPSTVSLRTPCSALLQGFNQPANRQTEWSWGLDDLPLNHPAIPIGPQYILLLATGFDLLSWNWPIVMVIISPLGIRSFCIIPEHLSFPLPKR